VLASLTLRETAVVAAAVLSYTCTNPIPHSTFTHSPLLVVPLFETVTDLHLQADMVARRPYGMIEMRDGVLRRIVLRPFPKYVSLFEALFWGSFCHRRLPGDRLRLYYNQPRLHPNYLSLKYAVSSRDTSLASMLGASAVLDEIARIKRSDAILTDAANFRISDRFLRRQGYERHTQARYHRNYIKRFYGEYAALRRFELCGKSANLEPAVVNDE
jgi:hypothetical protein